MKIIDFHSHILPYADHGSDSEEISLKQLKYASDANIDIIVATPHFYPHKHNVEKFVEKREKCYKRLMNAYSESGSNIQILKGAEILIGQGLENLPNLDRLCIENTKTLLVELPLYEFKRIYTETAEALISAGYEVILAHADRYNPSDVETMLTAGIKIQLNTISISGLFIKKHLKDWIERGVVYALGSDIHMNDASAYKKFSKAIKKLGPKADDIMNKTEKLIKC